MCVIIIEGEINISLASFGKRWMGGGPGGGGSVWTITERKRRRRRWGGRRYIQKRTFLLHPPPFCSTEGKLHATREIFLGGGEVTLSHFPTPRSTGRMCGKSRDAPSLLPKKEGLFYSFLLFPPHSWGGKF